MPGAVIKGGALSGAVLPPPFKSEVIRAVILSCFCVDDKPRIELGDRLLSDDIHFAFLAFDDFKAEAPIRVGESATLLRLLAPSVLALRSKARFIVGKSLYKRRIEQYAESLNCSIKRLDNGTIELQGQVSGNEFFVDCTHSSQFASGILLALPLIGEGVLHLNSDAVSVPYLTLTVSVMKSFGVEVINTGSREFKVLPGALYNAPKIYLPERDWSYAANFAVANSFGCNIHIDGLNEHSIQGDARIIALMERDNVDISDCPDLFPILCVAACGRKRATSIYGAARLADKESDRLLAVSDCLKRLGAHIEVHDNAVVIHGNGKLSGGKVRSYGDHRVIMAAAIASLICAEPVIIDEVSAVSKSAPQFFEDFIGLGGSCEYIR